MSGAQLAVPGENCGLIQGVSNSDKYVEVKSRLQGAIEATIKSSVQG
jgi:hypothetical protein